MKFVVAIAGRPNVGKSTLFNRLAGRRLALVDDQPGVTRDRRKADATLFDLDFSVIDTAGLEDAATGSLEQRMRDQTEKAIVEADITLFMIDARAGVTPLDKSFANRLRRSGKPVVLVANKVEGRKADAGYYEAFGMGFGDPIPVSAEHGQGMADLRDAIVAGLGDEILTPDEDEQPIQDDWEEEFPAQEFDGEPGEETEEEVPYDSGKPLRIAIVGRPNAGKSTMINTMIGDERLLTGPEAGITRDSISVDWEWQGRTIKMFDTAGMRRKARVQEKLEKLSVSDGLRAIQFAEVVVIMFDATISFEKQDLQIVDLIVREGRAPVIAFNKWDLVEDRQKTLEMLREKTDRLLPQVRGIRTVTISGQSGEGIERLMHAVVDAHKVWNRRISTAKLNRWLLRTEAMHPPPATSGRRIRLKYISQLKARPPTFAIMCSKPDALPTSYTRYLINNLREDFDLTGVPIRMMMRKSDNPYAGKKKKYSRP